MLVFLHIGVSMEHLQVVEGAKHQKYSVLPYVYVAHIVIVKREKKISLSDFLRVHFKKQVSYDALGYSLK